MSVITRPIVADMNVVIRPDGRHGDQRAVDRLEERHRARHQVDAGHDHRRGVDEGADGRRALHGVGQPDVERELRRLAHRAEQDQQHAGRQIGVVDLAGVARR